MQPRQTTVVYDGGPVEQPSGGVLAFIGNALVFVLAYAYISHSTPLGVIAAFWQWAIS